MSIVHFITHPEVVIDPAVPVPQWSLSAVGLRRMRALGERRWLAGIGALFSSQERKAMEGAAILAEHFGLPVTVLPDLAENDRSATGYRPRAAFEALAEAFFARPEASVQGWERAVDAQARIVGALGQVLARAPAEADLAIIAHGGVGALLLCHLMGRPISRAWDQPAGGGGHVFSFEAGSRRPLSGWRPIEAEWWPEALPSPG